MNLNVMTDVSKAAASPSTDGILDGLNPEQRAVALHGEGPLLVLAVVGSGKTRAIAHRTAYLIAEQGISPSHILCLTFTNKAAVEMRERIGGLLGGHTGGVTVSTFHALCARLLRIHHPLIQRSSRFVIYNEEDSRRLVREVARELGAEGTWEQIRSDMERLKNLGILPHDDLASALGHATPEGPYLKVLKVAYRLYEDRLTRYDAVDFPGLLHKTTRMLEEHSGLLDRVRQCYRYILVDEYQDTCSLQEWLLHLLSAPSYNLCAVGDDDQAIYAFRHADVKGILTFDARYPGAKVIRMEQNYRSAGSIIDVARQVISANRHRKPKAIYTANAHGTPVQVSGFSSEEEEAAWIRSTIQEIHTKGVPYGGMAILCRVASLFRPLERELAMRAIIRESAFFHPDERVFEERLEEKLPQVARTWDLDQDGLMSLAREERTRYHRLHLDICKASACFARSKPAPVSVPEKVVATVAAVAYSRMDHQDYKARALAFGRIQADRAREIFARLGRFMEDFYASRLFSFLKRAMLRRLNKKAGIAPVVETFVKTFRTGIRPKSLDRNMGRQVAALALFESYFGGFHGKGVSYGRPNTRYRVQILTWGGFENLAEAKQVYQAIPDRAALRRILFPTIAKMAKE